MAKRVSEFGFKMTEKQRIKLHEALTENILERYDNSEYWDPDVIETFATDNRLQRSEK